MCAGAAGAEATAALFAAMRVSRATVRALRGARFGEVFGFACACARRGGGSDGPGEADDGGDGGMHVHIGGGGGAGGAGYNSRSSDDEEGGGTRGRGGALALVGTVDDGYSGMQGGGFGGAGSPVLERFGVSYESDRNAPQRCGGLVRRCVPRQAYYVGLQFCALAFAKCVP